MIYEINREKETDYRNAYYYKSKNEQNQIITFSFYETDKIGEYYVTFFITSKRKKGFQKLITTGKDGIKSLLWAKECLIDAIKYLKEFKSDAKYIIVGADDERRRKVYQRSLIPLGFKINQYSKEKELYLNLDEYKL